MELVEDIRKSAFGPEACRPPKDNYANNTVKKELLSHSLHSQQIIVYKSLKYGIKNGDTRLIGRVIGVYCFYFKGTGQSNCVFEMPYLKRPIHLKVFYLILIP